MKKKSVAIKRVVLSLLTLFLIAYIFINSSFDADASDTQSLGVTAMLNDILHSLNINIILSNHFVRKSAHFTEYFVLGVLLFYTAKAYFSKIDYKIIVAPISGLVVACVDETIQLFATGRSGQITDVLLDFSGICTAVLILYVISKMRKFKKDEEVLNGSDKIT